MGIDGTAQNGGEGQRSVMDETMTPDQAQVILGNLARAERATGTVGYIANLYCRAESEGARTMALVAGIQAYEATVTALQGQLARILANQSPEPVVIVADREYREETEGRQMTICHDCAVEPGQPHLDGCDVARCLATGRQRLDCDCGQCGKDVWTGEWPGLAECREYGFWCYWHGPEWPDASPRGRGWVRCEADHPKAREDLNRLHSECRWDKSSGKWVRR